MNNIWLATDWHLWNTEYDDGRHKFKSITRLGQLADGYASVIRNTDLFIHLGDLCDPSNTNPEKLKSIIQSIPGTKVLCRGNHDTESDAYYLAAGFDYVCDILRIHDVIFSHIPVNVGVDQINIHGHLHTRKLSTLDHRYINAYECNYLDRPILLEDLLQKAITQPSSDWKDTKLNHVEEKMEEYINIDHEVKDNILDLSYEFDLEQQIVQEAIGAAIMTAATIASGANSVNKTIGDWYKQNPITEYVIYNGSESKMHKCIDDTYRFKKTASIAEEMVDKCFIYLRTSNNLDKTQMKRYNIAKTYWKEVKNAHKETQNETSIAPILHSLSATEIEDEDPLDEVIFEDPEDTIYWEQDDDKPDLYREKEPMAEAVGAAIMTGMTIASGASSVNNYFNNWYKQNEITDYVIFGTSEQKMYKCIDKTYTFKNTAERAEDQVDKTFVYLRTSNNLDKKQKERYNIAKKYWNKVKKEYKVTNESVELNEAMLKSEPDIYYNKDKFDSGEINLCFIVGYSGSGKTTMSKDYENQKDIEVIEMDDCTRYMHGFSEENIKEYGSLMYNYWIKGPGKKYYQTEEHGLQKELINSFIDFAIKYSKSHKNTKFIIEGVWVLYDRKPEQLKDYAVYIKGTSAITSIVRATKREYNRQDKFKDKIKAGYNQAISSTVHAKDLTKSLKEYQSYFSKNTLQEVTLTADHLAELHKAHPELSTILPDDGKLITDPTKYYCSKCWMDNDNIVAIASIRYPQANSVHYSEIDNLSITEGYEYLQPDIMNRINELYDSRITESAMLYTNDRVDIYDYKYEVLEEATKGADELYPVYVFLVNSGSAMAKLIGAATGDEYTHASISFDPTMRVMYSFGMKQENGKGFGFAVESINNSWYRGKDMLYSIYCVFVNQSQLKKMKDRVQYFVKYGTNFLFDFPGLFLNAMNISANPQHRWFCSRFVADVLNAGSSSKKNQYIKDASYMRPNDFTQTNFAHYICGGKIKNFRASTVKAQTLKAMEKEKNDRMLRGKKQVHYTVQRFQEAAAQLSPASNADMNKLNNKWGLKAIGVNDRDAYIAEEEEKLNKIREHDRKIKEMKQKNKQKLKAAKNEKKMRKLRVKNEEVHDPFNITDQDRFFDWNNYENTVLGENYHILALKDKSFRFMFSMNEVSKHSSNKLVPVYIILTYTGSLVSRAVKLFTGDEYTHASIAFDSSLTEMYTFGRARDESITDGMFKIEDVTSPYYTERVNPIPYAIYCVPVTIEERDKMIKKVNYFAQNKNKFQFDFAGLILNGLHIPNNPKNRYFCSRFVSEILNAGDPDNPLVAEPSLQHPQTFAEDDYAKFVCSGDNLAGYDKSVVDKVTRDIIRTEKIARRRNKVKNEGYIGVNPYDPFTSNVLHYKLAMLDESEVDNFMDYLTSFKIQYDHDGNVIISRKEIDQLYKYFNESNRLCKSYSESGNIEGLKEELAKIHYMVKLINTYYLSPNASKNNRIKSDIKQELLDLRGLMLTTFNVYIRYIKIKETNFNFQEYYDTSKYSKENNRPTEILTQINKVLVVDL